MTTAIRIQLAIWTQQKKGLRCLIRNSNTLDYGSWKRERGRSGPCQKKSGFFYVNEKIISRKNWVIFILD